MLQWTTFAWLANRAHVSLTSVSEGWSGRRGSNPRPTAWKAVTLPLSYSRLRARPLRCFALRRASPPSCRAHSTESPRQQASPPGTRSLPRRRFDPKSACVTTTNYRWPVPRSSRAGPTRAKGYGEGRTRTFEAARATDLQSAAFDRFATSPAVCVVETRCFPETFQLDGAGEGI